MFHASSSSSLLDLLQLVQHSFEFLMFIDWRFLEVLCKYPQGTTLPRVVSWSYLVLHFCHFESHDSQLFFLTLGTKFEHLIFFQEVIWSCISLIFLLSCPSTPLPSISFFQPFPPSLPTHLSLLFLWCFTYTWKFSCIPAGFFVFTQMPYWNIDPHCPLRNLPANKLFR